MHSLGIITHCHYPAASHTECGFLAIICRCGRPALVVYALVICNLWPLSETYFVSPAGAAGGYDDPTVNIYRACLLVGAID